MRTLQIENPSASCAPGALGLRGGARVPVPALARLCAMSSDVVATASHRMGPEHRGHTHYGAAVLAAPARGQGGRAKLLLQLIATRIASQAVAVPPESSKSESSTPSRTPQRHFAAAVAEPWYVAKLVWGVVCGAPLPVTLRDIPNILERLVQHIRRADERKRRPRQLDVILRILSSCSHRLEGIAC
jgi:hypothetical protein